MPEDLLSLTIMNSRKKLTPPAKYEFATVRWRVLADQKKAVRFAPRRFSNSAAADGSKGEGVSAAIPT
jgi:hypothetical protein